MTLQQPASVAGGRRQYPDSRVVLVIRRLLLVIFTTAAIGTGAELLLLEHTADWWQLAPLLVLSAGLAVLLWHLLHRRGVVAIYTFKGMMILFIASGVLGMVLHCKAKMEFKLEGNPSLRGFALFREALKGAMPPALAPGSMIQLGLIGLAYSYRHPILSKRGANKEPEIREDET